MVSAAGLQHIAIIMRVSIGLLAEFYDGSGWFSFMRSYFHYNMLTTTWSMCCTLKLSRNKYFRNYLSYDVEARLYECQHLYRFG